MKKAIINLLDSTGGALECWYFGLFEDKKPVVRDEVRIKEFMDYIRQNIYCQYSIADYYLMQDRIKDFRKQFPKNFSVQVFCDTCITYIDKRIKCIIVSM